MHYVLSDVHNDNKKFCEMLKLIQFSKQDHLFILGDLFDRAAYNPEPVELYFSVLKLGEQCSLIRGNHDDSLADYIYCYYAFPDRKVYKLEPYLYNSFSLLKERLTRVDMLKLADFIKSWPLQTVLELNGIKYLLAHAMTSEPEKLKADDYYLQGGFSETEYLECGIEEYISICGHSNRYDHIWRNRKGNVYLCDCGCGYSDGRLGCLCLETGEEFYIGDYTTKAENPFKR